MKGEFAGYALILVSSSGLAYWASLPASQSNDAKEWFSVDPRAVESITYADGNRDITLVSKGEGRGFWVSVKEKAKAESRTQPASAAPGTEASTAPSPSSSPEAKGDPVNVIPPTEVQFKAGDRLSEILDALKPLKALRVIGKAKDLNLKDFGLDENAPTLAVKSVKGDVLALKIGKRSYGSASLFALDEKAGEVILVSADLVEGLGNAKSQLFERRLVDRELSEFKKIKIVARGSEKTVLQGNKAANGEATWKDEGNESQPRATYKTWLDNLAKIKVQRYSLPEEEQLIAAATPFLELELLDGDAAVDRLVFRRLERLAIPGEKDESIWVQSKFLGGLAKVSGNRLAAFDQDIAGIMGKPGN